jgi:hypothetical protein
MTYIVIIENLVNSSNSSKLREIAIIHNKHNNTNIITNQYSFVEVSISSTFVISNSRSTLLTIMYM